MRIISEVAGLLMCTLPAFLIIVGEVKDESSRVLSFYRSRSLLPRIIYLENMRV